MNNILPVKSVVQEVIEERSKQDAKWGVQNHNVLKWFAILGEEYGEVAKAVVEMTFAGDGDEWEVWKCNYREELIQTAAVAIAMVESLDRNG